MARGPVATIHLPLKLKLGLHGNFVEQSGIEEWAKRRSNAGDLGPVRLAEQPLLWQERLQNGHLNGGESGIPTLDGTHSNGVV